MQVAGIWNGEGVVVLCILPTCLRENTIRDFFLEWRQEGRTELSILKGFWADHKVLPGQPGDHILCNSNSPKYRTQSNHKKNASGVLGCSTEQADDKAAKRVLH